MRIVVQVDGKKRGVLENPTLENNKLLELAMKLPGVISSLSVRKIFRIIEVKNKLINIVTVQNGSA